MDATDMLREENEKVIELAKEFGWDNIDRIHDLYYLALVYRSGSR